MEYTKIIPKEIGKAVNVKIPSSLSSATNVSTGQIYLGLGHGDIKDPKLMMNPANSLNKGGIRGTMPCEGTPFYKTILRPPCVPNANTFQVNQGFARKQPKGLAYEKEFPTDLPILRRPYNFNPALKSKLPYPY